MTIKSSQDPWIEPTAPLGDVVEQSGPFGGVCGPIGGVAKKTVWRVWLFSRSTFGPRSRAQLREPAHIPDLRLESRNDGCHQLENYTPLNSPEENPKSEDFVRILSDLLSIIP